MGTNGFVFQGLTYASMALAIIYFLLSGVTFWKLSILHKASPDLNTRKLFVMSCLLSAVLRTLSFTTMTVFDFYDYTFDGDDGAYDQDASATVVFFQKSQLVLFDFPDFCFVSAYILLLLAWAESYLMSRKHWLSSIAFRRVWLLAYLVLNIFLYGSQVGIYSLIFIPKINQTILSDFIYITLATFNLFLPVLWFAVYGYFVYKFAGFPYTSMLSKERLHKLTLLAAVWTLSRLFYGVVALTSVIKDYFFEVRKKKEYYSVALIFIFCVSEVIPILLSLRSNLIQSFSNKPEVNSESFLLDNKTPESLTRSDTTNSDMYEESDSISASSPLTHSFLQGPLLSTPVVPRSNTAQSRAQPITHKVNNMNVVSSNSSATSYSNDSDGINFGDRDNYERNYSNDSTTSSNYSRSTYDDEKHQAQKPSNTPLKHTAGGFTSGGRASTGIFNKWIGF